MRLYLLFLSVTLSTAAHKFITVKGRLLCGQHPAFNTLVRLWPQVQEKGYEVLGEEFSTQNGTFLIKGKVFTDRNYVVMKIYHDCADGMKPGQRKFIFHIPTKYASEVENAEPYEFGELNLETKFRHNEEREEELSRKRRWDVVDIDGTTVAPVIDAFESPDERQEPW